MPTPTHHARRRAAVVLAVALLTLTGVLAPAGPAAALSPPSPHITKIEPNHGPAEGGNEVVLTGYNLEMLYEVRFGDRWASILSQTPTSVVVEAPPGPAGLTVDVLTGYDWQPKDRPNSSTVDDYTYDGRTRLPMTLSPSHGSPAGGTVTTLTGAGIDFANARAVTFGGEPAEIVSSTASSVTVTTPAGMPNQNVQVELTTADGHLEGTQWTRWIYDWATGPPRITDVSPREIYASGGEITITGENLAGTTKVTVGDREIDVYPWGETTVKVYVSGLEAQSTSVRVATAVGTSEDTPADDLTIVPSPPPPVVTSLSPNRGSVDGGTVVTVRGRHLATAGGASFSKGGNWGNNGLEVISDEELRVIAPAVDQPGLANLIIYTAGGSTWDAAGGPQDDFTFEHQPGPLEVSPNHGPASGGNPIGLRGGNVNLWRAYRVDFVLESGARLQAGIRNRDGDAFQVSAPAGPAGETATIEIFSAYGEQINGPYDTYRWDAASTEPVTFSFAGSLVLPTIATREMSIGGQASLVQSADGRVHGALSLSTVTARLKTVGNLPVTAKLGLVPASRVVGSISPIGMQIDVKLRVKITEARVFGAIPLAIGNTCQTKQLAALSIHSISGLFSWLEGGLVASSFAISDLNGCSLLAGLLDPRTATTSNGLQGYLLPRP